MQIPQWRSCESAAEDLELPPEDEAVWLWLRTWARGWLWACAGSWTGQPVVGAGVRGRGVAGAEAGGTLYVPVDKRSSSP